MDTIPLSSQAIDRMLLDGSAELSVVYCAMMLVASSLSIYTPIVCVLALLVAICVPFIDGLLTDGTFYYKDF